MYENADALRAVDYFERSIESYPSVDNTSICPLRAIDVAQTSVISEEFKEVECP